MVKERIKTACPHCGNELDVTSYVEYGKNLVRKAWEAALA